MAENNIIPKIDHYVRLALRHRWLLIIPLLIALSAGIYLSVTLPRIYQARTLILVEPQRVPRKFVESIVNTDIEEQVTTLRQQILSRTNLEQIINQFDLYSGPEHRNQFLEDKLDNLRRRISIDVSRASRGPDAFSINFTGQAPAVVRDVTNALASSFIDINLRMREDRATGTSQFLDSQLEEMRKRLEEVEESLKAYRMNNMGELPEQLSANLKMLDRIQLTMTERQEALREAKQRLSQFERDAKERMTLLENQLEQAKNQSQYISSILLPADTADGSGAVGESSELDQLRRQYNLLLTKYTEKHPDVLRLRKVIDDMESRNMASIVSSGEADDTVSGEETVAGAEESALHSNPAEVQNDSPASDQNPPQSVSAPEEEIFFAKENLKLEQEEEYRKLLGEIREIEEDIAELNKQKNEYQRRVDNTPKREQDLLTLQRDYRNIQESYSSLLDRKLEAEIAVSMERRSKGEQFRILDPAATPQKPISPDVNRLLLFSLAGGLAIGAGIIFLLDLMDTSFRKPEEVVTSTGLPVLVSLPKIRKPHEKIAHRVNQAMSLISLGVIFILFSAFSMMAVKGVESTLSVVRKIGVLNRFMGL